MPALPASTILASSLFRRRSPKGYLWFRYLVRRRLSPHSSRLDYRPPHGSTSDSYLRGLRIDAECLKNGAPPRPRSSASRRPTACAHHSATSRLSSATAVSPSHAS